VYRKAIFVFCLLLTLFFLHAFGEAESDWPTAQHDARRSGHASAERTLYPPLEKKLEIRIPVGGIDALAVAGDRLYISSGGPNNTVYAVDANTGLQYWNFTLEGGRGVMGCTPAVYAGLVFFGGQGVDKLYAIDASTGRSVWQLSGMVSMYGQSPVVVDDVLRRLWHTTQSTSALVR